MRGHSHCSRLSWGLSILAALPGSIVHAREGPPQSAEPLEEIVVTGQRLAQQRSIQRKRNSLRFIDAVSADDMGRLPDRNVAEALDRLPGISLTFDQGEGRFAAIRGLHSSLNHFTINGMAAGSPEVEGGGRRVPLDVIGGELLEAIEVVKVQLPDMDAQGIGGTINLITAGPFDYGRHWHTLLSVQAGHDELNDERPYAGEATVVRVAADNTWGWLIGVAHSSRRSQTRGMYQEEWDSAETDEGARAVVPENAGSSLFDVERGRSSANVALEWRPSGDERYYLRGFLGRLEEDETRWRFAYFFRNDLLSLTPTTGTSTGNHREQELRFEHKDKRFLSFALGGENTLGDTWALDYTLHLNDNRQEVPNSSWQWRAEDTGTADWRIDGDGLVEVTAGTADSFDPADFIFRRRRSREQITEERGLVAAFNLRHTLRHADAYVKAGARYARTQRSHEASETTHAAGAIGWTLADLDRAGETFSGGIDGRQRRMFMVDVAAADAFFDAHAASADHFELEDQANFAAQVRSDYQVEERVLAGYALAQWGLGPGTLLAGIRIEHTSVASSGFELDLDRASARFVTGEGGHTMLLPGVVARFELTDDVTLRAAWTHTLGRPNYEHLAPASVLERNGERALLQIGNPQLKTRKSTNYDLALEWYFGRGSLLAAAAFEKRIENENVARFATLEDSSFAGETFEQLTIATFENARASAVRGFEVSYQQQFDFLASPLDGIGIAVSYAGLDSRTSVTGRDDTLPLVRQPDWTRSAALFYHRQGFELALALSAADSFLAEISEAPHTDFYAGANSRLDLRASYSLRQGYGVFFEWQNIDGEPALEYQGGVERQKTQYEIYGQTWYLGFNARF